MHSDGSTRIARPLISPRMSPSGQARTHAPQPMHLAGSISGCKDAGSNKPDSAAAFRFARLRISVFRRRQRYTVQTAKRGTAYKVSKGSKSMLLPLVLPAEEAVVLNRN